ncbi:MAG: hypothetical protein ABSC51_07685 [Gaiellaceae bacterium]|jgi:hypothetical protein
MNDERKDACGPLRSLRSFLLGGVVGASAALVTRRRRRKRGEHLGGLVAFEDAPCYREEAERER